MTNKGIWAIIVAAAFVAGMLVSATPAFAPGQGQGDTLVANAIDQLTTAVQGIPAVQGPQGEQGPQGVQGPPGPPGSTITITKRTADDFTFLTPGQVLGSSSVSCLEGEQITGGGYVISQQLAADNLNVVLNGEPAASPNQWVIHASAPATNVNNIGVKAIVYCANIISP